MQIGLLSVGLTFRIVFCLIRPHTSTEIWRELVHHYAKMALGCNHHFNNCRWDYLSYPSPTGQNPTERRHESHQHNVLVSGTSNFYTLGNGYISPDLQNLKFATGNISITVFEDGNINVNSHYTNLTTKSNSIVGHPCVHHRDVHLVVILLLRSKGCKVRPTREEIVFIVSDTWHYPLSNFRISF